MSITRIPENQSLKRDLWKVDGCVKANDAAAPNFSFPTLQGMYRPSPRAHHGGDAWPHRLASGGDSHALATGCRQGLPGGYGKADLQLSPTACHAVRVVVQEDTTASVVHATFLMLLNVSDQIQGQRDWIAFEDTRHSRRQAFLGRPKPRHRALSCAGKATGSLEIDVDIVLVHEWRGSHGHCCFAVDLLLGVARDSTTVGCGHF